MYYGKLAMFGNRNQLREKKSLERQFILKYPHKKANLFKYKEVDPHSMGCLACLLSVKKKTAPRDSLGPHLNITLDGQKISSPVLPQHEKQ